MGEGGLLIPCQNMDTFYAKPASCCLLQSGMFLASVLLFLHKGKTAVFGSQTRWKADPISFWYKLCWPLQRP